VRSFKLAPGIEIISHTVTTTMQRRSLPLSQSSACCSFVIFWQRVPTDCRQTTDRGIRSSWSPAWALPSWWPNTSWTFCLQRRQLVWVYIVKQSPRSQPPTAWQD